MPKQIVLSGIRPTGRIHIGNYFGSLQNFLKLQNEYHCYFFIADLHSLNEPFDPKTKYEQTLNIALDYIAAGLDPKKCVLFVQSHVHEHAELSIILSNVIPVSYLYRMTQYKEKSDERDQKIVNAGLLYYPVLMAADILIYKANMVPVGEDQTQHVEFARAAARFFNNQFGEILTSPKALYTQTPKIKSLLFPDKKMSKSLGDGHCIYIDDEPEVIRKKLSRAVTDTGSGKSNGAQNLLQLLRIFGAQDAIEKFERDAKKNVIKYSELKAVLANDIAAYFSKYRARKKELLGNKPFLEKTLRDGAKKAKKKAQETLREVKKRIGLMK